MQFSEKELEDWLYENPGEYYTGSDDFQWIGRQVTVASGIIDLLGLETYEYDPEDNLPGHYIHVVELKAVKLRSEHLTQVCRYAADLNSSIPRADHIFYVKKAVITPDCSDSVLQFEADALCVELRDASPSFNIGGAWHFNKDAIEKHRTINLSLYHKSLKSEFLRVLDENGYAPDPPDFVQTQSGVAG